MSHSLTTDSTSPTTAALFPAFQDSNRRTVHAPHRLCLRTPLPTTCTCAVLTMTASVVRWRTPPASQHLVIQPPVNLTTDPGATALEQLSSLQPAPVSRQKLSLARTLSLSRSSSGTSSSRISTAGLEQSTMLK